ncbi:hypothetical protein QWY85_12380 [Neolewinella lacunae]|uniref:START domain-containing protein n=1 Tax=Neolewinella lacunae TaxID=1517758 RepID=A0A923T849_9BACT|nr:hypothetical protein [Neolewinella lacunae]MBC6995230.1 hypothetical protein [Neolewinella lacunae]MDN3635461.1 hypothetical protein [Neolewinella lacunae]
MRFLGLFLVFMALTQVPGLAQQEQGGYQLLADEAGVRVYVRSAAKDVMSVRVTTTAQAKIVAALAVLDDAKAYPSWVHRCTEAFVLPGGNANRYTYCSRVKLPFPFRNREVVAIVEQSIHPTTGVLTRRITNAPQALPASKDYDREQTYSGEWVITPNASGGIDISSTFQTTAASGLPAWLRREVMTSGPVRTMQNFVARVEAKQG